MRIILFTNARDEDSILEWVVHHLNLGFSHIYITDHKSAIPLKEVLKNVPSDLITIDRLDGNIDKRVMMHNASNIARDQKYDWMLYLDCDEFLILNYDTNVNDFISKYKDYDQLGLNWLMFGTNNKETFTGTIIENFTRCDNKLNMHIKSFLNLNSPNTQGSEPHNPHVYRLRDMSKSIGINYSQLNPGTPYFFDIKQHYSEVSAYIAHYVYQSYETYVKRKIRIPRDDVPEFRKLIPKEQLHLEFNSIENFDVVKKYNNTNIESIKKYTNN